jgi:RNA polymerase sigma factor (TIGR02999 family)
MFVVSQAIGSDVPVWRLGESARWGCEITYLLFLTCSLRIRLIHQDTACTPKATCVRYHVLKRDLNEVTGGSHVELTQLLQQARAGDAHARDALFAAAYPGLQQLARARLRAGGRSTLLDTRGLVHESFLRYVHCGELRAEDRRAFFAFSSQVMRSVIINAARDRARLKRGSGRGTLTLNTQIADMVPAGDDEVMRVHEALDALEQADARLAQLVQMRYFGGYSEQEVADTLGVTVRTVQRLWLKARIMLQAAME